MKLLLVLAFAVALGLTACGAEEEIRPAGSTDSSQAALPDVARVVCELGRAPTVEVPAVRPQRDGVHVELVNETDMDLSFFIEDPSEGGMGDGAPRGNSTQVVDLHPGTVSITCYDPYTEDGSEVPRTPLEIVDEDSVWVPTRLDCDTAFTAEGSYTEDARGKPDPLDAAHAALDPYAEAGDVVEPAGYPDAQEPEYRLARDGEVVAVVELFDDGGGGWLPSAVTGCSALDG